MRSDREKKGHFVVLGECTTLAAVQLSREALDRYLELVGKESRDEQLEEEEYKERKRTEAKILAGLTVAAVGKDQWALEQIGKIGDEIGSGLASFIKIFHDRGNEFVNRVILVSTVAEKLGKGVPEKAGSSYELNTNDLLIARIRGKAKETLKAEAIPEDTAETLSEGVARSNLSSTREFLAFAVF